MWGSPEEPHTQTPIVNMIRDNMTLDLIIEMTFCNIYIYIYGFQRFADMGMCCHYMMYVICNMFQKYVNHIKFVIPILSPPKKTWCPCIIYVRLKLENTTFFLCTMFKWPQTTWIINDISHAPSPPHFLMIGHWIGWLPSLLHSNKQCFNCKLTWHTSAYFIGL